MDEKLDRIFSDTYKGELTALQSKELKELQETSGDTVEYSNKVASYVNINREEAKKTFMAKYQDKPLTPIEVFCTDNKLDPKKVKHNLTPAQVEQYNKGELTPDDIKTSISFLVESKQAVPKKTLNAVGRGNTDASINTKLTGNDKQGQYFF